MREPDNDAILALLAQVEDALASVARNTRWDELRVLEWSDRFGEIAQACESRDLDSTPVHEFLQNPDHAHSKPAWNLTQRLRAKLLNTRVIEGPKAKPEGALRADKAFVEMKERDPATKAVREQSELEVIRSFIDVLDAYAAYDSGHRQFTERYCDALPGMAGQLHGIEPNSFIAQNRQFHERGDALWNAVAERLPEMTKLAARYGVGGGVFGVLAPHKPADVAQARAVAIQLADAICAPEAQRQKITPDAPTPLPIRAISETLIQSVGVMRDMLTHVRKLLEDRWAPQRGPLRTFPSAQSLVEYARKLQNLIDAFQGSFGTLKQGFVYPNLDNDALARQNEFWWCCARAAAELGTLQSSSARVKRAESMVRAIANDLATFAGPSNVFVNCLGAQKNGREEKLAEDHVMFTLETLVESPTGRTHYQGPFAADELDVESRLLAELARVQRDLPAEGISTVPTGGRPFDAMQNSLRTDWHEAIEKFKGIAEGMQEQHRRQEEGLERVSRVIQSVAATPRGSEAIAPVPALPAPAKAPVTYTVAKVLDMAGVSDTTLNKYAKQANVKTPGTGKRNHQYSEDEVRKILDAIINNSSDRAMKERCRKALNELPNPN